MDKQQFDEVIKRVCSMLFSVEQLSFTNLREARSSLAALTQPVEAEAAESEAESASESESAPKGYYTPDPDSPDPEALLAELLFTLAEAVREHAHPDQACEREPVGVPKLPPTQAELEDVAALAFEQVLDMTMWPEDDAATRENLRRAARELAMVQRFLGSLLRKVAASHREAATTPDRLSQRALRSRGLS